ncbi:MAG TPA: glycosyltransferase family 87 protein [Candidatus Sulfotelmatobacter sp.]|nr:glycosyltransferase family 87 protein [Candidatus Sulfotelmatobacter sp.]
MSGTRNVDSWLTARRLLAHAALLGVALWSIYIWTLATPGLRDRNGNLKGTDFLHFYTLGALADGHRGADLYRVSAQTALASQRVPQSAGIRYLPLYPPQVSLLFAPLATLPYVWALALWWFAGAFIYFACCYLVWRASGNLRQHRATAILAALAFPAFFNLIAWGQTSALALLCFTALFFALRGRHEFVAGLVLGCLIFKPQLGLAAAVVFLAIGAWKIVLGAILSASAQLGIGILYYGMSPLRQWMRILWNVPALSQWLEPRPYQTHSLRTFWSMIVPWSAVSAVLYVITGILVLSATISLWRHRSDVPLAVRYSALLLTTVLVAPHLTVYDLVILAPAFLLLTDWLIQQKSVKSGIGTLLYLVYVLPLLAPLTRWTHVQLSVIAMAALLYVLWRISRRNSKVPGNFTQMQPSEAATL